VKLLNASMGPSRVIDITEFARIPVDTWQVLTEGWVDALTGPWGFALAFAAGLLSFLSPCVLPLVPAYLAHLTGTTGHIEGAAHRRKTVTHALSFVLGFTAVFTFIGASVGLFGFFVRDHLRTFEQVAGLFLIVMGLNLIGVIRVPWLYRTYALQGSAGGSAAWVPAQAAATSLGGVVNPVERGALTGTEYVKSFGVGAAFSVGWTPCVGPVLGAILTLAATSSGVAQGAYLLFVYSLGLGVPFVITAIAFVPVTAFLRRIRGALPLFEALTGAIVIFVGILIFTDSLTLFNRYFDFFGLSQV
jgi:cytochrome c-type biogenesis protein